MGLEGCQVRQPTLRWSGWTGSRYLCCTEVETLEMCSLLYREGEHPKAQAKQSIAWYSDDKQCLLYPNVNQMIT
jgi:Leu/Phe-tRNA-protein transferase